MTDVYVVRHAEAEGNLFRRAHGCFNGQLTELGKKQLQYLAARFEGVQLDAVYASNLRRAMETADVLCAGRGLQVQVDPELRETDLGVWEDLPWGELQHSYREQYINFNKNPDAFRLPGAELFADAKRRMLTAVRRLAARHDGGQIAVCSHGGAINALLTAVREVSGTDFGRGFSDNTAVSLLRLDGEKVHVVYANDNSHLPPACTHFARQNWWQSLDSTDSGDMRYLSPALEGAWRALFDGWAGEAFAETRRQFDAAAVQAMNAAHPGAFAAAVSCDVPAGFVLTQTDAQSPEAGEIYACYLEPRLRGKSYSPQLLGQAISALRKSGIGTARVILPQRAQAHWAPYFEKYGFVPAGETGCGRAYEKDISI